MREPRRLRESGSPRARALIQAGKGESPGRHTESVVLAGLGLGGASGAAEAATLKSAAARSPLARSLASLKQVALSKAGIGVVAAAMAGSAGYATGRQHERAVERAMVGENGPPLAVSPPAPPAPLAITPGVSSAMASSGRPDAAPRSPLVDARTAATSTPSAHASPPRAADEARAPTPTAPPRASPTLDVGPVSTQDAAAPAAETLSSIAAQLESIRVARGCVQKGDGKGALAALDAYLAQNPHGTFEEEELALRVRAMRLLGDLAGAARERANLQSRFPQSVHLSTLE